LGGISRALLPLEDQGGDLFFGEPALDLSDWMRCDENGCGRVNILDCVKLIQNPKLYTSFLLWMLSELFETLPEEGDMDKPKLVFFFDEAHMLFSDAPKALVQKVEQVVKLIRSKGVGIYFVTQSPSDIPDSVLAQLSHRVQHALRAYTPAERKAVRVAAQSFRENPAFKAEDVICELGVGKALVSCLDAEGIPQVVQHTSIICPQSLMAAADAASRSAALMKDGMEKYDETVDNESAYEMLNEIAVEEEKAEAEAEAAEKAAEEEAKRLAKEEKEREKAELKRQKELERQEERKRKAAEKRKEKIQKELMDVGVKALKRGLFKTLLK
ncbi:MAG: DUF853 family protein, partial [Anaerotignum sp.]|nr:DUF853 family protein [Anaerotignum sp.]